MYGSSCDYADEFACERIQEDDQASQAIAKTTAVARTVAPGGHGGGGGNSGDGSDGKGVASDGGGDCGGKRGGQWWRWRW